MQWFHDTLYVAGSFNRIGGIPCDYFAKWDGTRWCCLAPQGELILISAFAVFQDSLYFAGAFTTIQGDTVNNVAKWIGGGYADTCGFGVGIAENRHPTFSLHPNPTSTLLTITSAPSDATSVLLTDPLGRVVLQQPVRGTTSLDVRDLAPGPYLAVLLNAKGNRLAALRWVKE
jgi:hypothetical protein